MRYLGIYFVAGRNMRCAVTYAKRSFYRSSNAIFGTIRYEDWSLTASFIVQARYYNQFCLFVSTVGPIYNVVRQSNDKVTHET